MRSQAMGQRGLAWILVTAVALFGATQVAAGTIPSNGTITEFDVDSGQVSFDWDRGSAFDIVGEEVTLFSHTISTGGDQVQVVGELYEFVIPNFFDPLPEKSVEVTMTGRNPGAAGLELPRVLDIIASDSPFDEIGPGVPVFGSFVDGTSSSLEVFERWEIFPNPDHETVKIFAPTGFELEGVRIETRSIPEPSTLALLSLGLIGLSLGGRGRAALRG